MLMKFAYVCLALCLTLMLVGGVLTVSHFHREDRLRAIVHANNESGVRDESAVDAMLREAGDMTGLFVFFAAVPIAFIGKLLAGASTGAERR